MFCVGGLLGRNIDALQSIPRLEEEGVQREIERLERERESERERGRERESEREREERE
jgi:hypothetical protein